MRWVWLFWAMAVGMALPARALVVAGELPLLQSRNLVVVGERAYVALQFVGLQVIDVSESSRPVPLGVLDVGGASALDVSGTTAYLVRSARLRIVDASDPQFPVEVGSLPLPSGALDVAVSGDFAYVVRLRGLIVIDVSDPGAPRIVGSLDLPRNPAVFGVGVDVAEGVVWLRTSATLMVVDVSDPTRPRVLREFAGPDGEIAFAGGLLYYVTDGALLFIFDVSDPTAPVRLLRRPLDIPLPLGPFDVAVEGGLALVTRRGELRAFDVSDPLDPVPLGSMAPGGRFPHVLGSRLLLLSGGSLGVLNGLRAIDLSQPAFPRTLSTFGGASSDVEVSRGLAFLAEGGLPGGPGPSTFRIFDVSDPSRPVELGSAPVPHPARDVEVRGRLAYVAGAGLSVFDVRRPDRPVEVAFVPGDFTDVELSGGLALVADPRAERLRILSVLRPGRPREIASIDAGRVMELEVARRFAYAADLDFGLRTIDFRIPRRPRELGGLETNAGGIADVEIRGDLVAHSVFGRFSSVRLVDVSRAGQPARLGTVGLAVSGIALGDGLLFAGSRVFDVCDPTSPKLLGGTSSAFNVDVELSDGLAFMPGFGGVTVVDHGPEYRVACVSSDDREDDADEPSDDD
jgi:hypothetical protein